jgi:TolB protein
VVVSDHSGDNDLYRVDLSSGQWVALAPHPAADYAPAWSPDGGWIAFESERGSQADLFLMRPDGSELQRLSVCGCWGAVWSPDGERIAAYARQGLQTQVVWLNLQGQLLGRTPPVLVYAGKPMWSPNGTQLAVTIVQERRNQIAVWDIPQAEYRWVAPHLHPTYHPAWSRPMDLPWRWAWLVLLGGILLVVRINVEIV